MKKVLICEDHEVVLEGIKYLLEKAKTYNVVGCTKKIEGLLYEVQSKKPDLLILDISLSDGESISIIPKIRESFPKLIIMIFTMYDSPQLVKKVKAAGANGFLLKESSNDEILQKLESAKIDGFVTSDELTQEKRRNVFDKFNLTKRENEIIQFVMKGFTTAQIAEHLCLSFYTVETHRKNISRKLDIHSPADLIRVINEHKGS